MFTLKFKAFLLFLFAFQNHSLLFAATDYFADNGASSPWYHIMRDRGIYHNGTTYVCWQGTSMDPYIQAVNHSTGLWSPITRVGISDIDDDDSHGNPAMLVDSDGYIHVTAGGHGPWSNGKQKYWISTSPEDISSFQELPLFNTQITYATLEQLSDGRIFYGYRNINSYWGYRFSHDGGQSWTDEELILDYTTASRSDKWFYGNWYVRDDKIYYAYSRGRNNIKKGALQLGTRENCYVMWRDLDGIWRNVSGDALSIPLNQNEVETETKIWDSAGTRSAPPNLWVDSDGTLYIGVRKENYDTGETDTFLLHVTNDGVVTEIPLLQDSLINTGTPEILGWYDEKLEVIVRNSSGDNFETWSSVDGIQFTKEINALLPSNIADLGGYSRIKGGHPDAKFAIYENASANDFKRIYLFGDAGFVGSDGIPGGGNPELLPETPTELVANVISSRSIDLKWTDNSDSETSFAIEQRISGGTYSTFATLPADSEHFAVSGLLSNESYEFRVKALNAFGSSSPSNIAMAITSSPQNESILLSEDFNDGNYNGWSTIAGNWKITNNQLEQEDNTADCIAYWNASEAQHWFNYTFTLDTRSTDDDSNGIVFYYQDENNYYRLITATSKSELLLMKNGVLTTLAASSDGYTQGVGYQLEIKVSGGQIICRKDGVVLFGGPITNTALSRGSVGLFSRYNSDSFFDNILVKSSTGNYLAWAATMFPDRSDPMSAFDADADGDGESNLIAYSQGGDPLDGSPEQIQHTIDAVENTFGLVYRKEGVGINYNVQYSTDLSAASWQHSLDAEVELSNGSFERSLPLAEHKRLFLRLVVEFE